LNPNLQAVSNIDKRYTWWMFKDADIMVLLALSKGGEGWSLRMLSEATQLPHAAAQRSVNRLAESGLYERERKCLNKVQASEFLLHSVKFLWPARLGGEARGIPTAWDAPVFEKDFERNVGVRMVWPHPYGEARGIALVPIHRLMPEVARQDPDMYERFALLDGLRIGDARLRSVSARQLAEKLDGSK